MSIQAYIDQLKKRLWKLHGCDAQITVKQPSNDLVNIFTVIDNENRKFVYELRDTLLILNQGDKWLHELLLDRECKR